MRTLRFQLFGSSAYSNQRYLVAEGCALCAEELRCLGDFSDRVPPVPIPNTAVKPVSGEGTAIAGD